MFFQDDNKWDATDNKHIGHTQCGEFSKTLYTQQ